MFDNMFMVTSVLLSWLVPLYAVSASSFPIAVVMSFNESVPLYVTRFSTTDDDFRRPVLAGLIVLLIPFLFSNLLIWVIESLVDDDIREKGMPQTLPYKYPCLKSTIPFLFDGLDFFSYAS